MTFQPKDDYLYFDGRETITYSRVTAQSVGGGGKKAETVSSLTIPDILFQMVNRHEIIEAGGAVRVGDLKCQVPAEVLKESGTKFAPKEGDRITRADGSVHYVMYHEQAVLATRFRVFVRRT